MTNFAFLHTPEWRDIHAAAAWLLWDQFKRVTMPGPEKAEVSLVEGQYARDFQSLGDSHDHRVDEIDVGVRVLAHDGRGALIVGGNRLNERVPRLGQIGREPGQSFRAEVAPDQIGNLDRNRSGQKDARIQPFSGLANPVVRLLLIVEQRVEEAGIQQVSHG
jgi:hypothetical protein